MKSEGLDLGERGLKLNYDAGRLLTNPFLPMQAKEFISELAALVGVMAREIEKLKNPAAPGKGGEHEHG